MARKTEPARDDASGRFQTTNAEHAERFDAAIAAFRAGMPNEFDLISRRPLGEGVKRISRILRSKI